jgi:hypothetical protein
MHRRRTASVFMALVTPRKDILERNAGHRLAELLDLGERVSCIYPTTRRLGNDAGDGLAVTGNHDRFAALDLVKKLGRPCL